MNFAKVNCKETPTDLQIKGKKSILPFQTMIQMGTDMWRE